METQNEFKFEITKFHGVISEGKGGWKLELNEVSWNDRPSKFDLRTWAPDHKKMGKGITMTQEEIESLKTLLNNTAI